MREALGWAIPLAAAALNIWFWLRLVRGEPRFRAWVGQRFDVVITTSHRGHWKVHGTGSWWGDVALELLQLAYYMGGFSVWALGLLVTVGVLKLLG